MIIVWIGLDKKIMDCSLIFKTILASMIIEGVVPSIITKGKIYTFLISSVDFLIYVGYSSYRHYSIKIKIYISINPISCIFTVNTIY